LKWGGFASIGNREWNGAREGKSKTIEAEAELESRVSEREIDFELSRMQIAEISEHQQDMGWGWQCKWKSLK
jgi:hypothetical protein